MLISFLQIFTNADKAHAAKALSRLGLEDCFEGIICFETLNPPIDPNKKNDKKSGGSPPENAIDHGFFSGSDTETGDVTGCDGASDEEPKIRILCKPSVGAMKAAVKIANADPKKTVRYALV